MLGYSPTPQNEETPFRSRNPFAIGKLNAFWMTVNYMERCKVLHVMEFCLIMNLRSDLQPCYMND
jgi:GDP-D-mannose dehydratase